MTSTASLPTVSPAPTLAGQTVLVIGGSAGIGYSTAQAARSAGADAIITARNAERLSHAASELGAVRSAAFDATDPAALEAFFTSLTAPVDHVLVSAGRPYYAPLAEMDLEQAARSFDDHVWLAFRVAQLARAAVRPGGSLTFIGGTGGRRTGIGLGAISVGTVGMPAAVRNLALELAPTRVNLIAPGFVDTGLSAELLGDGLDARRQQLRDSLPIGRVVGPDDIAALAVHLMTNTALTGATFDIGGGQQLL
ncbi:SDR family oxidoreductase [Solirubrobacter phytolaccae]|uniref:SDR family oxidoreductase n=1 Tax=Solirubrobacter phytolaccae TaxID=1404360 RepID=A0A9X3S6X0_9ACTN|nr:SDR family oxidoreductase [Solirubrobacter phytolaccae]MDA0179628.1 SDR family oxidoreductase [Solirubrobacter phytolaccae]